MQHLLLSLALLLALLNADPVMPAGLSAAVAGLEPAGRPRSHIAAVSTGADLELQLIRVTGDTFMQGDRISIYTYIENIGTETSEMSTIDYYASLDTEISHEDHYLGSEADMPAVAPGGPLSFFPDITLPVDMPSGKYFIGGILDVDDADNSNHVEYDAIAVTISNEPEIRIRPLTLEFLEEASFQPNGLSSSKETGHAVREHMESILPALLQKAERRGFVRVIVGLESAYQSFGIQADSHKKIQRKRILDTGRQLIESLRNHGVDVRHQYESIPFMAMSVDVEALEILRSSPLVTSIEEDRLSRPFMDSSNPIIGSPMAWAEGYDGSGWTVAVLDTGVDAAHPWFTEGDSRVVAEACYSTYEEDVSESLCPGGVSSSVAEGSGSDIGPGIRGWDHGTHVAGIVAGNDGSSDDYSLGVAPGADIISMQVFSKFLTRDDCGSIAPCLLSSDSDQIAAMLRVLVLSESMNIAAVNMSLGGDLYTDQVSCDLDNLARKAVIQSLRDAGIATVIAAGNRGRDDAIAAPGCISNAISVGATNDKDEVASFSNVYSQLHLLAPGEDIYSSTPPDKVTWNQGTSMSAPHVAGAWAVMKQRAPLADVGEVLNAFTTTGTQIADQRVTESTPTASPADDPQTFPRINLDAALGEPRTSFGIFNDGPGNLNVLSILPEPTASWISLVPAPPYAIEAGGLQVVSVVIDFDSAPPGDSQLRLLVASDDPDENPYPDGILVDISRLSGLEPEYESSPAPFSVVDFGSVYLVHAGNQRAITVTNRGTADLTISCEKSGPDKADFTIGACDGTIPPGGNANIELLCSPTVSGPKTASLDVTSNDASETSLSYRLYCMGLDLPTADEIFDDGFEGP